MSANLIEPITTTAGRSSVEQLVLGWWNTSLSPVGKGQADENQKEIAGAIIKGMIDDLNVDSLALGEVTAHDLEFLKIYSNNPFLAIHDGTLRKGRLQFDTGIIYDTRRLTINNHESFIIKDGGQNSKLANRVDFISKVDDSIFHIFVSHWPSRIVSEENIKRRKTLAMRLREQVGLIHELRPDAFIILMGDFNDEPFDESLSYHLQTTRDRHLAKTTNGFLYNPFWRQIGESEPHFFGNTKSSAAGSCFSRNAGIETRWRTFDQILFSSAFLGSGDWHLNEKKTMILRSEPLVELVQNNKVNFDHLPVLSVIERENK